MKKILNLKSTLTWLIATICVIGGVVLAGSLTPPGSPEATYVSLNDIYDKLTTGATTTEKSFTPTVGTDTPTMHTLSEIFEALPEWLTLSDATTTVPAGYYEETDLATIDTDLVAGNIAEGTTIFGVEGGYTGEECPICSDVGLPKTGQTESYMMYDDGYYEKGTPASGDRFTDNSDNTITDNATGLDYVSDHSLVSGDGFNFANPYTWSNAIIAIVAMNNANYAGHNDWRLPNIIELMVIADYGSASPAINGTFFPNTQQAGYWSSTTAIASGGGGAWYLDFSFGDFSGAAKVAEYYIRPVRGN